MTSQRSRFLASLSERLQSDLAAQEQNREEPTPAPWPEHTGRPSRDEPSPEEIADDPIGRAPAMRAAQAEPEQDHGYEAAAPPDATPAIGAWVRSQGEHTLPSSVPWSETGLPLRLREAIASVRRVSHEMHEPPGDDYATYGRTPSADHPAYDDHSFDEAAAHREPPDDPLEHDAGPEYGQIPFSTHAAYEEAPDDELVPLDDDAGLRHEPMRPAHDATYRPAADDELVLLPDGVVDDGGQTSDGHRAAYEEAPPDDELIPHGEDGGYPHGQRPLADAAAYQERAPGDEAAREHRWLDGDGETQEPAAGYSEDSRDRQPLWRGATKRYGLHAAAFAVAIAFVALAGFGLGILSGAGDVAGPLARDTLRALTEPALRLSAQDAPLGDPERPAEPGELVTVRVAPAPVAAVPGPAPAAPVANSALPLPPPPKPVLRQSAPAEAAPTDRPLTAAVDDAAAAPLEAAGTGGPFQPLFAKLPASRSAQTRVFVHYSAGVVGAPATAMHLVRHLKAAGFAAEVRAIEFPIPTNSIRYFFDADRAQAEALRGSLEGQLPGDAALTVMDFTSYQPRPQPGLIEIWLRA